MKLLDAERELVRVPLHRARELLLRDHAGPRRVELGERGPQVGSASGAYDPTTGLCSLFRVRLVSKVLCQYPIWTIEKFKTDSLSVAV